MPDSNSTLQFYLNGALVVIDDPSPSMLLVDYLRSPEVRLTGTKKPCGQGGCGGCTVILSDWPNGGDVRHRAINSCLRRLCSLNGMAITTIEGTGGLPTEVAAYPAHHPTASRFAPPFDAPLPLNLLGNVKTGGADVSPDGSNVNPVAYSLATNNGSQCGYCSVGFVMNMSEFITNKPHATKKEIEGIFDGNLCRCTGYRPILTAMETWASDWDAGDEQNRMKCFQDNPPVNVPKTVTIPVPQSPTPQPPLWMDNTDLEWFAPASISDLQNIYNSLTRDQKKRVRFIHGGTSFGIYKAEFAEVDAFIDLAGVAELNGNVSGDYSKVIVPAGATYTQAIDYIEGIYSAEGDLGATLWDPICYMLKRTAGRIVRNVATVGGNLMLYMHHVASGDPFPSDLATALSQSEDTNIVVYLYMGDTGQFISQKYKTVDLFSSIADGSITPDVLIIAAVTFPLNSYYGGQKYFQIAQKVALREVNSHSIVNSGITFRWDESLTMTVRACFGGVTGSIWRIHPR